MHNLKIFFISSILLTSFAWARIYKPLDDLSDIYKTELKTMTAMPLQALSLKEYQAFLDLDANSAEFNTYYTNDSAKPKLITMEMAEVAFESARNNPVVSLYINKYDPDDKGIGFCFGRAMFVDVYLAINGLDRGSIKKAFVVGPMTNGGTKTWGWHVTTIVQSSDADQKEVWLAIDPIMGRVLTVHEWYEETLKMSTNGRLRLYIAESGKFAQRASQYDERAMSIDWYNKYFIDMMKWFEDNDVSAELKLE